MQIQDNSMVTSDVKGEPTIHTKIMSLFLLTCGLLKCADLITKILTADSSQSASQGVVESIPKFKSWEGKEVNFVSNVRKFPVFQLMEIL